MKKAHVFNRQECRNQTEEDVCFNCESCPFLKYHDNSIDYEKSGELSYVKDGVPRQYCPSALDSDIDLFMKGWNTALLKENPNGNIWRNAPPFGFGF